MKYAVALVAGLLSSAGMAVLGAVFLGIAELYLTGHGVTWQNRVYNWHFISMSFLDAVLVLACGITLVLVSILVLKLSNWPSEGSVDDT